VLLGDGLETEEALVVGGREFSGESGGDRDAEVVNSDVGGVFEGGSELVLVAEESESGGEDARTHKSVAHHGVACAHGAEVKHRGGCTHTLLFALSALWRQQGAQTTQYRLVAVRSTRQQSLCHHTSTVHR
jgi:hypothetical protein